MPKFLSLLNLKTQNQEIVFYFLEFILDILLEPLNTAFEASFLTPHDSQLATAVARSVRLLPLKGGAGLGLCCQCIFPRKFIQIFFTKLM